jgi:hypothetical protein
MRLVLAQDQIHGVTDWDGRWRFIEIYWLPPVRVPPAAARPLFLRGLVWDNWRAYGS